MATIHPNGKPNYRDRSYGGCLILTSSIRWQVMRDLIGAPRGLGRGERARVATRARARGSSPPGADGRWGGAAWNAGGTPPCTS